MRERTRYEGRATTRNRLYAFAQRHGSNPSRAELDRLNAPADLIDAERRVLVCRISGKIETDRLLVTHLSGWLRQLAA